MTVHFVVEDVWEVKSPLVSAMQAARGSRLFPCVEVDLNQPIWHLDLQFQIDEDVIHWRRFIFASVEQLAATVLEHAGACRLHMQSERLAKKTNVYEMRAVERLQIAHDRQGRSTYVVKLQCGELLYPNHNIPYSDLIEHRMIYDMHASMCSTC